MNETEKEIRDTLHQQMVEAASKIGIHWIVDIASTIAYEVAEEISKTRQGGHRYSVNDRPWRSISVALGNDAQYFKHVLEKAAEENVGARFTHPLACRITCGNCKHEYFGKRPGENFCPECNAEQVLRTGA